MRIVLIVVAAIVAVILIIPAFVDKEVKFTKTIEISKPVDQVYNVVKDFNFYKKWNVWSQMDKDAVGELSGPVGEVGSKWSWNGDTVGVGSLTIEELVPDQSIISKLEFKAPMQAVAQDLWKFDMIDSSTTKVSWSYAGTVDSYFARYGNLFLENVIGPDYEKGLSNLKELVESLKPVQVDSTMTTGEMTD